MRPGPWQKAIAKFGSLTAASRPRIRTSLDVHLVAHNRQCWQPIPLLFRNERIEEIEPSGIPLGLIVGMRYEPVSLDLQLGDIVVFTSGGILECQNTKREAFGPRRLAVVLASLPQDASAKEISSAILCSTDEFSGHTSAVHDDRSPIVLRLNLLARVILALHFASRRRYERPAIKKSSRCITSPNNHCVRSACVGSMWAA